jgi:hypothetical protein
MKRSARSTGSYSWVLCVLALLAWPLPTVAQTIVPGGTISTDTTWTLSGSPYTVTGDLTIEGTDGGVTTLTIEPGVEVRVQSGYVIYVGGVSDPGALIADGNAGGPATITFTSDSGTPQAGDWDAIYFRTTADSSSLLRNVIVEYGGGSSTAGVYLYLNTGQAMTLEDVTIRHSARFGIYQRLGSTTLTNITISDTTAAGFYLVQGVAAISQLTISDSASYGVDVYNGSEFSLDGCSLGPNADHDVNIGSSVVGTVQNCTSIESVFYAGISQVTWTGNTFDNWGARTSRVGGGDLVGLIADNTINKVGGAIVEVAAGTSALDGSWTDAVGNPYVVLGDVAVAGTDGPDSVTTLHIQPGLELRFASTRRLWVGGTSTASPGALVADGNAAGPATITFTSDSASPAAGDWNGIQFRRGTVGDSVLRNVVVEYAGRGSYAGLYIQPDAAATITVEEATVRHNENHGVFQDRGTLVMNDAVIADSGSQGLRIPNVQATLGQLTITGSGSNGFYVSNTDFDLDGCSIGPSISHDVHIENAVTGTIQNCTSIESVYYNATNSQVTWTGNTFNNWGALTSRVGAGDLGGLIADNTVNKVGGATVEVAQGTVSSDATWNFDVGNPYIIAGNILVDGVEAGDGVATLVLVPGLELRFNPGVGVQVGGTSAANPGALIADGDGAGGPATITFTSNNLTPAAGDWRSLYFYKGADASSILRNVVVEYGGNWIGAVYLNRTDGTTMTLENVTILESGQHGLYQNGGDSVLSGITIQNTGNRGMHLGAVNATISQLTLQGATGYGIYISGADFSIDGCTVDSNSDHDLLISGSASGSVQNCDAIESVYYTWNNADVVWNANTFNSWGARTSRIRGDDVGSLASNNTFNAVPGATVEVYGETLSHDATWTAAPGPYVFTEATSLTVQGTDGPDGKTTLILEPGVTIKLPANRGVIVGGLSGDPGELIADGRLGGDAFDTVNFTSSNLAPATGDWAGIEVRITGRAEFHEAQVRYADVGVDVNRGILGAFDRVIVNRANVGLNLDQANLEGPLTRSTFKNCDVGVRSNQSNPVIRDSDIAGGSWGVENLSPATDCVDAQINFWNAVNGPSGDPPAQGCETDTPTGSGARITEAVLFDDWLEAPSDDGDAIPCNDGDGFYDPCTGGNTIDCDDNCCIVANPSQEDVDGDGTGDACDENPVLRVSNDPLDGADFDVVQDAVDAAFQSGTRIEIFPGLGPYYERVRIDRLPPQVFRIEGLDTGSGPVVLDGGVGAAINAVTKPLGVVPMRFHNLTLGGAEGLRASVGTEMSAMVFSTDATALVLDGGDHALAESEIGGASGVGADVATGASLNVRRTTMTGLTDAGLVVAGSANLENTLISEGADGIRLTDTGSVSLDYSTIANHTGAGLDNTSGGVIAVQRSIIHGNTLGDVLPDNAGTICPDVSWSDVGSPDCSASGDNLSVDPLFDLDYGLQAGSPCLDHGPDPATYTGAPPTDLDGGPRLVDHDGDGLASTDPGAFEMLNPALVPGEVQNVLWQSFSLLTWDSEPSATEYHVYRDSLPNLSYAGFGICNDGLDGDRTDTQLDDAEDPGPDQGFFYLVTADNGSEEGSLGFGTYAERSNFGACP